MTTNTINYNKHLEDVRSHKAQEKETNRSNLAQEAETNRHNVTTEIETNRHNLETERLTGLNLQELVRHNQASESISYAQMANAITTASISAAGRIGAANISAAASRYASDNNFAANTIATNQRREAAQLQSDTAIRNTDVNASTELTKNSTNNAFNAFNVMSTNRTNLLRTSIEQQNANKRQSSKNTVDMILGGQGVTEQLGKYFIKIGGQ